MHGEGKWISATRDDGLLNTRENESRKCGVFESGTVSVATDLFDGGNTEAFCNRDQATLFTKRTRLCVKLLEVVSQESAV